MSTLLWGMEWDVLSSESSFDDVFAGGEYRSNEFSSYLKTEGVRHEFVMPNLAKFPEQNKFCSYLKTEEDMIEALCVFISS